MTNTTEEQQYAKLMEDLFQKKVTEKGLDPMNPNLTHEEISVLEELTRDAQDEAKKELGMVDE